MKVFISWSGDLSHRVALVLRDWLPSVIQALQPYVSSEDIDKGVRWSTDIANELDQSQFGILCITPDNADAPWLNFEAGALSKSIDKSRVSPFLFGLKRSEIRSGPLLQFQSTIFERDDVLKLLHSLNSAPEPPCLDDARLDIVFSVWWPKLQEELTQLLATQPALKASSVPSARREGHAESDILEELLELVRTQHKLLNSPPDLLPPSYLEQIIARLVERPRIASAAYIDLSRAWTKFKELQSSLKESDTVTFSQLNEIIQSFEKPLKHILARAGRGRDVSDLRPIYRREP